MIERYRYPGVNYFTEADKDIFCGRENEINRLFTQILISRTVVLHADSGIGKSSLIRAGLFPEVDQYNQALRSKNSREPKILPLVIRVRTNQDKMREDAMIRSDEKDFITTRLIEKIKEKVELKYNLNLPVLPIIEKSGNELWYLTKQIQVEGYELLLIFDQFEELQTYRYDQVMDFEKQLATLFHASMPTIYDTQINELVINLNDSSNYKKVNDQVTLLESKLRTRALFAVREDKLGTMSLLTNYFPDILKNDFFLKGLDLKGAEQAIMKPAQLRGKFQSHPFEIQKEAAEYIISILEDSDTKLLDPLQIQIVCKSLERKVSLIKRRITKADVPPIKNIIMDFYEDTWDEVRKELSILEIGFINIRKRLIEKLLVSEKRVRLIIDVFRQPYNDEAVVKLLEKKGILRKSFMGADEYYELSHDRLIKPLSEDLNRLTAQEEAKKQNEKAFEQAIAEDKENKRKLKVRLFALAGLIVMLLVLSGSLYQAKNSKQEAEQSEIKAKESQILSASKIIRKDRPTFAYVLAKDYEKSFETTSELKSYVKQFDTLTYSFLSSVLPLTSQVVSVRLDQTTNILSLVESDYNTNWIIPSLIINSLIVNENEIIKLKKTSVGEFKVIKSIEGFEIRNENDILISAYRNISDDLSAKNIDITPDGNYLLANNIVFRLKTGEVVDTLPSFGGLNDQMVSTFLNDNKHLAVGYWSGHTLIFKIDESREEKISLAKAFQPIEGLLNIVVTAIDIDSKDEIMAVGDKTNNIVIWKIGDLEIDNRSEEIKPLRVLRGHLDEINCLSLSPNDSLLLSGSRDRNAILWNIHSGEKLSFLRGMESEVKFVAFSNNENEFYTATENNLLSIWKIGESGKLYESNDLMKFSPLDYYIAGLMDLDWTTIYENEDIKKLHANVLGYILSFPDDNYYPEDQDYLNILKTSIKEMEFMYDSLIRHPEYKDGVNSVSRVRLARYFDYFQHLNKPRLLLQNKSKDSIAAFSRSIDLIKKDVERLTQDTSDVYAASSLLEMAAEQAKINIDSANRNLNKVIVSLEIADNLLRAFEPKWNRNSSLQLNKKAIANIWSNTSYYALFQKNFNLTIYAANKALQLNPEEKIADTNLALGYLLTDQWNNAEKIYRIWNNKHFPGYKNSADEFFLMDIDVLEKAGIYHPDFEKAKKLLKD